MDGSIRETKAQLRRSIRGKLRVISASDRRRCSDQICQNLSGLLVAGEGDIVMTFSALSLEPDLSALHALQAERCFRLTYPKVEGDDLRAFVVEKPDRQLKAGAFGILEPDPDSCEEVYPESLHTLLFPGLAFDPQTGGRLGQGKGFYDRWVERLPTSVLRVGIGFELQLVKELPMESHDCRMQVLVTEKQVVPISPPQP